ncbi:unnamed protein product [Ectocarpus sp. 8 AP-2014]
MTTFRLSPSPACASLKRCRLRRQCLVLPTEANQAKMSARSAAHVLIWLVCLLVATSVHAQGPTCSNGVPGIQSEAFEDICCAAGCLQCGGSRCISINEPVGLGADDCCNNTIRNNGDDCATTGEGPCVIVTPPFVANPCLDPNDVASRCNAGGGVMNLRFCEISEQDAAAGDLAACFDAAGPENIVRLFLSDNDLKTLPPDIFNSLTNLFRLDLDRNNVVTLPSGIFDSLTALEILNLRENPNLECLPTVPSSVTSLNVDTVGTACGCFIPEQGNPCGQNVECSPGATGFTCG